MSEIKELQDVVDVAEEVIIDEGVNKVRIAEDVGLVAVGALAIYGAYKLLKKPVVKAAKWISSKFKKKDNTENNEQQTNENGNL